MKMAKDKLVLVKWEDAGSRSKWTDKNAEEMNLIICRSVGYLLKKTAKKVIIYATRNDQNDIGDQTCIPRGCVKSIRNIREPK